MSAASVPVSVILPTCDRLRFLPTAIESVRAQTLPAWELIVADDGSAGETRQYLTALQSDPRIRIVWLEHCGNPAVVRNAALAQARGQYVAFLDSDDYWEPCKLESQLCALKAAPSRQWSYTGFVMVDACGSVLPQERSRYWLAQSGWIFELLAKQTIALTTPTVMVRRQLLERMGGFDEGLVLYEDYDLWMRLALASEVVALATALTRVRKHDAHFRTGIPAPMARRRLIEKHLLSATAPRHRDVLRRERARAIVALAKWHAARGQMRSLFSTLFKAG